MLGKLAFRNVKRQTASYIIYFITVVFTVSLMFAVNNILLSEKLKAMTEEYSSTNTLLVMAVIFITLVVGFIISYATLFLLRKRKKEFGIYMLLGIDRFSVLKIFIIENLIIGSVSFLLGCFLGLGVFQIINSVICSIMGNNFPPLGYAGGSFFLTLAQWAVIFIAAVLFSGNDLRRSKVNDLISVRKTERREYKKWVVLTVKLSVTMIILGLIAALIAIEAWLIKDEAGADRQFHDIIYNVFIPFGALGVMACVFALPKNKIAEKILSYFMLALIATASAALIWLPLESSNFWQRPDYLLQITTYFYLLAISGIVLVCAIFLFYYFSRNRYSGKLKRTDKIKGESAKKLEGGNVFYYRQMSSVMSSNAVIMGIIAVLLSLAFFFTNYAFSSRYVQLEQIYNDYPFSVASSWRLNSSWSPTDYSAGSSAKMLTDVSKYSEITYSREFGLYHSSKRDDKTWWEYANQFYCIIKQSDLNSIFNEIGHEEYVIPDNSYILIGENSEIKMSEISYLEENPITVFDKELQLADVINNGAEKNVNFFYVLSRGSYRSYRYFIAVPDDFLQADEWEESKEHDFLIVNAKGYLPPEFYNAYSSNRFNFKCRDAQIDYANSEFSFLMVAALFLSVSFMFISMALLALKTMSDADLDKKRYKLLGLLGTSSGQQRKILFKQLLTFFALPLLLPLFMAGVSVPFSAINSLNILGYVPSAIYFIGAITPLVYIGIFACYFAATFYLSAKNNISAIEKPRIQLLTKLN